MSISGNADIDVSGDDSDSEDAITEIKKNVKDAVKVASKKKTTEEEEDEDEDDEDESGSGSDKSESKPAKASRKEEIEKVDDAFLDLKH